MALQILSELSETSPVSGRERDVAHGAMDRRIDPSWWTHRAILVPASAPRQRLWYVLTCLWGGTYKIILAANRKE